MSGPEIYFDSDYERIEIREPGRAPHGQCFVRDEAAAEQQARRLGYTAEQWAPVPAEGSGWMRAALVPAL